MPRVIRMRTYLNHPGKCHLARGVGSSVNTYNHVMKKSFTPGCRTPSANKVVTNKKIKNKK
jgi:hypothetical protein